MKKFSKYLSCFSVLVLMSFFLFVLGTSLFNKRLIAQTESINEKCFKCHKVERLEKVLPSGEKMHLFIDPERFKASVHGSFECLSCHTDVDVKEHPKPVKITSVKEYRDLVSKNCVTCHTLESLSPIHKGIVKEGKLSCAECHGSHYMISLKETNQKIAQNCLKCHKLERLSKVLPTGEKMSLYVDEKRYTASIHGKKINCLFCHTEVDVKTHPKPVKIESLKTYARQINKNCLNCHPTSYISSFHKDIVKEGKTMCTHCHTSHYVKSKKEIRELTEGCIKCHRVERLPKVLPSKEKMYLYVDPEKFAKTPHAKMTCFACHYDIYNMKFHPITLEIKSRKEYTKQMVNKCTECHTYESISKHPGHARFIKDKKFMCIDCHGYHFNIPLGGK